LNISQHIANLLYRHNCVIIPEFGGFVANTIPAFIDKKANTIHPPSKGVIFNKRLTNNDGLLVNEIARFEKIDYEMATQKLLDWVNNWKQQLKHGERIEFKNVGIVYFDQQENIQFIADKDANFNLDAFGLFPIQLYKLEKEAVAEKENIIPISLPNKEDKRLLPSLNDAKVISIDANASEKVEVEEASFFRRNRSMIAASLLIPLGLYTGLVVFKSGVVHNGYFQASDLNPFSSSTSLFEPRKSSPELTNSEKEVNFEEVMNSLSSENNSVTLKTDENDEGITVVLAAEDVNPAVHTDVIRPKVKENMSNFTYQVIGGCFSNEFNAASYVSKLKNTGYDAFILDIKNGLHRVSLGAAQSRAKALRLLSKVRNTENPGAWLLTK